MEKNEFQAVFHMIENCLKQEEKTIIRIEQKSNSFTYGKLNGNGIRVVQPFLTAPNSMACYYIHAQLIEKFSDQITQCYVQKHESTRELFLTINHFVTIIFASNILIFQEWLDALVAQHPELIGATTAIPYENARSQVGKQKVKSF